MIHVAVVQPCGEKHRCNEKLLGTGANQGKGKHRLLKNSQEIGSKLERHVDREKKARREIATLRGNLSLLCPLAIKVRVKMPFKIPLSVTVTKCAMTRACEALQKVSSLKWPYSTLLSDLQVSRRPQELLFNCLLLCLVQLGSVPNKWIINCLYSLTNYYWNLVNLYSEKFKKCPTTFDVFFIKKSYNKSTYTIRTGKFLSGESKYISEKQWLR